ncbi:MAG: hypothetical protein D6694_07410 [Gammaproteobacteria bacterium]|nr:MAG: hypothetical protein D6694_07410 [Gammaproteobacteria bacterium]
MAIKKPAATASNKTSSTPTEYVDNGGRATIIYGAVGDSKVVAKGFLNLAYDSHALHITLFAPKEGASEKVIASGFVKEYGLAPKDTEFENPVLYYITLLEGKDDSVYALMNENGAERSDPPVKLSLYTEDRVETGDITILTGKVLVPSDF